MKIHAIQTGSVEIKERQRQGKGHGFERTINTLLDTRWTPKLPILAWVIEHEECVIVVDVGETARTSETGYFPRWHPFFRFGTRMYVQPEDEIGPAMQRLGLSPDDVRWVVMTHLHTDHAGGLHHFPKAEILISRHEFAAAQGFSGKVNGYLLNRFPSWLQPRLIDFDTNPFASFPQSVRLTQSDDVRLVPTQGHSAGHLSVIVQDNDISYFLAGDTSYTEEYLLDEIIDGVSADEEAAAQSIHRILAYARSHPTVYLPSHDPDSVARLQARQVVGSNGDFKRN